MLAQFVNWIVAFTTPLFLAKSSYGPYFLFGGCSLLTSLVCLAFQPETRDASLEDVDQVFGESPWRTLLNKRRFSLRSKPNTTAPTVTTATTAIPARGRTSDDEIEEVEEFELRERDGLG